MPYMKFLFVRSDVCLGLPSDSTSRWTPLPLTMQFPLLGLARDFHPLDNAHAERTKKVAEVHLTVTSATFSFLYIIITTKTLSDYLVVLVLFVQSRHIVELVVWYRIELVLASCVVGILQICGVGLSVVHVVLLLGEVGVECLGSNAPTA